MVTTSKFVATACSVGVGASVLVGAEFRSAGKFEALWGADAPRIVVAGFRRGERVLAQVMSRSANIYSALLVAAARTSASAAGRAGERRCDRH
jgi:hypothetical protein